MKKERMTVRDVVEKLGLENSVIAIYYCDGRKLTERQWNELEAFCNNPVDSVRWSLVDNTAIICIDD